jgi:aminoglycoside phosphotransferase (APT) family kinase protein
MRSVFPSVIDRDVKVSAVESQGWCNLTFWVDALDGSPLYVLRLCEKSEAGAVSPSLSVSKFEKERYVLKQLSTCRFAPRVPRNGSGTVNIEIPGRGVVAFGYLFQTQLPFAVCSQDLGERARHDMFWRLGEIAKEIHAVKVEGFGTEFDERRGSFKHESFYDFIVSHADKVELATIDSMIKRWIISILKKLESLDPAPSLFHQDLLANWGNVLVDSSGRIQGVVDWEFAGSGLALHNELATFLYVNTRDGVSPERTQHDLLSILEGYGISHASYLANYEDDIQTLVLLDAISAIEKHALLVTKGEIEKEPWRKVFAERATALCYRAIRSRW